MTSKPTGVYFAGGKSEENQKHRVEFVRLNIENDTSYWSSVNYILKLSAANATNSNQGS